MLCELALALPPAAVTEAGCEPPTPVIEDCVPCTCPTAVAACPMAVARAFDNAPMFTVTDDWELPAIFSPRTLVSILSGKENETTCFRLGNGTTSLSWARVRGSEFET